VIATASTSLVPCQKRSSFPTVKKTLINDGDFRRRQWTLAVRRFLETLDDAERARLIDVTFHDLRHSHTPWLIAAGWPEFRIVR
jgi:integrase